MSIAHRCYLFEVAFVWELTKETIVLPLGCLQGGLRGHHQPSGATSLGQWSLVCLEQIHRAALTPMCFTTEARVWRPAP